MKITIVTSVFPKFKRGLAVVALNHARELTDLGFTVSIFCRGEKLESQYYEGIKINTFPFKVNGNVLLKLRKNKGNCIDAWKYFYENDMPDVVHIHDYIIFNNIFKYLPSHIKKIFTVHDPLLYHQKMLGKSGLIRNIYNYYLERKVYRNSHIIHYISEYTLRRFAYKTNELKDKLHLIENWVDYNNFIIPLNKEEVRINLGIVENEFIIFSLRALEPRMGIDRLIKAFSRFTKENEISCRLIIGGKGPMLSQLQSLIKKENLDNVHLLGYVPDNDVISWYQAANLVVIPSLDGEGFGLPILEAMACGTPVMGTPLCAIPEILSEKKDRLFSGENIDDIYEGINHFYFEWLKKGDLNPLQERSYVTEKYSKDRIIKEIINDYNN